MYIKHPVINVQIRNQQIHRLLCYLLSQLFIKNFPILLSYSWQRLYTFKVCVRAKPLQSCPTLCDPMDCSPPGSSVHGTLQARILEGVAMPSSRASSWPRDLTHVFCVSCTSRWILDHCPNWEAMNLKMSPQPPLCRTHVHLLLLFALFHSPGSWVHRSSP